jgi:DNA gyrase subunit B
MSSENKYSATNIGEFEWLEHIRHRPAMYLGDVNIKGFTELLKGLFSNVLFNLKAKHISFEITESNSAILKVNNILFPIIDSWSKWTKNPNRTNSYTLEFQVLNALCSSFKINLRDKTNKSILNQEYEKGKLTKGDKTENEIQCSQLEIEFSLDKSIWGTSFKWNENFLNYHIREFAYLYNDVKFVILNRVDKESSNITYFYKNGLKDRLDIEKLNSLMETYLDTQINTKIENFHLDISFAFRAYYIDPPFLKSYVNDYYTYENGSHVDSVIKGLTKGIKKYILKYNLKGNFKISKKRIKKHLISIINIRMDNPQFSGSLKNKLGSKEIIKPIENYVSNLLIELLEKNKESTMKLLHLFEK